MSCPEPESLSRWVDGTLDPRSAAAVRAHALACDACQRKSEALGAVGEWLAGVEEPGAECLSPEAMATLLEGRIRSPHVETCPRCAGEFVALSTLARKRFPRRRDAPPATALGWMAAAAILFAAGVLFLLASQTPGRAPSEPVVKAGPAEPPASHSPTAPSASDFL
jgi:hypothetical protein